MQIVSRYQRYFRPVVFLRKSRAYNLRALAFRDRVRGMVSNLFGGVRTQGEAAADVHISEVNKTLWSVALPVVVAIHVSDCRQSLGELSPSSLPRP